MSRHVLSPHKNSTALVFSIYMLGTHCSRQHRPHTAAACLSAGQHPIHASSLKAPSHRQQPVTPVHASALGCVDAHGTIHASDILQALQPVGGDTALHWEA